MAQVTDVLYMSMIFGIQVCPAGMNDSEIDNNNNNNISQIVFIVVSTYVLQEIITEISAPCTEAYNCEV